MVELTALRESVNNGLGIIGSRSARVTSTMDGLTEEREGLTAAASDLENVDMAEATIAYSEANLAYEAALATTAQVNQVSLLNYM